MRIANFIENKRLLFTWILAAGAAAGIFLAKSRWEQWPLISTLFFASGCILAGSASLGRLWCALYIAGYKDGVLVTEGPYSMSRNPLYFFNLFGAVGMGLATETLLIPVMALAGFALYYPGVIESEEERQAGLFPQHYESYRRRTPAFFPNFSLLAEPEQYVVRPKVFKRNMFDALWLVWLLGILEIVEALHEADIIPNFFSIY
jgi:protein-S-isoprenylcysteine O-methyltransferase Ste14